MAEKNFLKKVVYWPAVFWCLFAIGSTSAIFAYQPPGMTYHRQPETAEPDHIAKIISFLETRTPARKVLVKATGKLHTLNRGKIRLIYSLCERFSGDRDSASSNIAFSLVSAMIVLS